MRPEMKALVEKEWWMLRDNLSQLFSGIGMIIFITALSVLVPPTPQSSYAVYHQITSNPELFGVSGEIVRSLGRWVFNFGAMVAQIPVVFGITIYIAIYSYLANSILSEKTNRTIEVLFSTSLHESEIIASKMIMGAFLGIGLVILAFLINTMGIEAGFHHYAGTWWMPTRSYLFLMVLFSGAFSALAFPVALVVGMRGSKVLMASGTFVVFIPIGVLIFASRFSATDYVRTMLLIAIAGAGLAVLLTLLSRRIINRLAFITN